MVHRRSMELYTQEVSRVAIRNTSSSSRPVLDLLPHDSRSGEHSHGQKLDFSASEDQNG
jgi:hypothetical protein